SGTSRLATLLLSLGLDQALAAQPGLRFGRGPRRQAFSLPLDVTPGGQPVSRFTWKTTDGSNTPSRWRRTSLREQPSSTIGRTPLLHPPLAHCYIFWRANILCNGTTVARGHADRFSHHSVERGGSFGSGCG